MVLLAEIKLWKVKVLVVREGRRGQEKLHPHLWKGQVSDLDPLIDNLGLEVRVWVDEEETGTDSGWKKHEVRESD